MNFEDLDYKKLDIDKINLNDKNWKKHPKKEREMLRAAINEVGFVGAVLVNKRTMNLIDGEMRLKEAKLQGADKINALIVDVPREKELKILSLFDKVREYDNPDKDKYIELLKEIEFEDETLIEETEKILKEDEEIPEGKEELAPEMFYDAKYVTLVFKDDLNWEWAKDHYGLGKKKSQHSGNEKFCHVVDGDKYIERDEE